MNNFTQDDLQEFGSRYLESNRFQHQFPEQMPPEARSTIAMQDIFPRCENPISPTPQSGDCGARKVSKCPLSTS